MKKLNQIHLTLITVTAVAAGLIGCGSGSSSTPILASNGQLLISYDGNPNSSITSTKVTNGSIQKIYVSLNNSTNVIGQKVNIAVADPKIATVSPASCSLSSGSMINSTCIVTINGLALGSTSLDISSKGYKSISLTTVSQANPVYGYLAVESSNGQYESVSPVNSTYSISASTINIKAGYFGSSGIESSNMAVLNFTITESNGATLVPNGPQACANITSAMNTCTIPNWTLSGTPSAPLQFTGTIAGPIANPTSIPTFNTVLVNESAAAPQLGKITVVSQNGHQIPYGMKAPIFVNWDTEQTGSVNITLTSSNQSMPFYWYEYSNAESIMVLKTSQTSPTCNLTSLNQESLNCGFGIINLATSESSTTISSALSSPTGAAANLPTTANYTLTAIPQESAIRTFTFTNNSKTQPIWIGITQGGANSYIYNGTSYAPYSPTIVGANSKPGGGSMCGTSSNQRSACPVGSTCRPGGASPQQTTPMFCYWDSIAPQAGSYLIESNGGSAIVNISGSSADPGGIIWSGNFYARTNCNESGICEVGSCGNGAKIGDTLPNGQAGTGLVCAPGTGASGGIVTLGELTFQKNSQPDYYDVSIINGVNMALSFGPDQSQNPFSTNNAYTCGTAGGFTVQGSYPSATGLPAATWNMQPAESSFPSSLVQNPQIYYSWVDGNESAQKCSSESCLSNLVCGYHLSSPYSNESGINQGSTSDYQQYCGNRLAWLTADSIGGFNPTTSNLANSVFNFNQSWTNPVTGNPDITVTNLQLCNLNTFSSYTNPAPESAAGNSILACGGVTWSNTRLNDGFTLVTPNANWITNVQPTINWLKQGCPTCYTYPFDDPTSTFTCTPNATAGNAANYQATFRDLAEEIDS